MTPLCRTLVAGVAAAILAAPAVGQRDATIAPRTDSPPQNRTSLSIETYDASRRPGGEGWLRIEWKNGDRAPHTLTLELTGGELIRITAPPIAMGPEAEGSTWLPFPRTRQVLALRAGLETGAAVELSRVTGASAGRDFGVLLVSSESSSERRFAGLPLALWQSAGSSTMPTMGAPDRCPPGELPPDWRILTGYDLVVVETRDPDWTDAAIEPVLAYVRAGGRLLIVGEPSGAPQALAPLAPARGTSDWRVLGNGHVTWWNTRKVESENLPASVGRAMLTSPFGIAPPSADGLAGPLSPGWLSRDTIDEVAPLPSHVFLAIVLSYLVVVGLLGSTSFRRGARPWLALLVVPAAGILVTAVILGVSAAREGGDALGTRDTLTILDQPSRRATLLARRTVFATRPPTSIVATADTLLMSGDFVQLNPAIGRPQSRYFRDLQTSLVDGSLVPSCTPTPLATVQVVPQRARLRLQDRADGGLDVLDGAGLAVRRERGAVVVRRSDGRYLVMDQDGVLRPASEAAGRGAVQDILNDLLRSADASMPNLLNTASLDTDRALLERNLFGLADRDEDRYWAILDAPPPDLDDLGMDVTWGRQRHRITGMLAPDDFVEGGR